MKITYLCHASFLLEYGNKTILLDPFFTDEKAVLKKYPQVKNPDFILAGHGHDDHIGSAFSVAGKNTTVIGIVELCSLFSEKGIRTVGMNFGGTVRLSSDIAVSLVRADHSSSYDGVYTGEPAGFVVELGKDRIYFSSDTAVFSDMKLINEFYRPNIGILCVGGHFTADMKAMAYACNHFFDFETVIPMHYNTFPPITVNIDAFPKMVEKGKVLLLKPLEQAEL